METIPVQTTSLGRMLKRIHVAGTAWFGVCAVFLLILALRQAGFKWWIIFSFSGYSLVLFLFFVNVYIFAIFRGVARSQYNLEHPLTTSPYYIGFYDLCPFLGGVAGGLCAISLPELGWLGILSTLAEGTLGLTFLVWILLDPLIGFFETMMPECAAHRKIRLEAIAEEKRQKEENKKILLEELERKEAENLRLWNQELSPLTDQIVQTIGQHGFSEPTRRLIIQAGAKAWQMGGIICMNHFHKSLITKIGQIPFDYIAIWWDGIGTWQRPHTKKIFNTAKT